MALVNTLRRIAESARKIPGRMELREHSATLVISNRAAGARVDVTRIPILVGGQNPKVKFPSQRDIAFNIMSFGSIEIGPITPEFLDAHGVVAGGTPRELINRELLERGDLVHIVVKGPQHPNGAKYRIENTDADQPIHFSLRCSAVTGA